MTSSPPTTAQTVPALLRQQARERPAAVALREPGSAGLTYRRLLERVEDLAGRVAARVGPDDRVLVPMTNTSDTVVAVLAAMSAAVAVPVDATALGRSEQLRSRAAPVLVLVPEGGGPVPDLGIPVLPAAAAGPAERCAEPTADRVALLVETSGSTSRPRLVELTHGQWLDGAARVVRHLGLVPGDRTVNLMPLFHNHGLNGSVLASLCAGGEVVCPGEIRFPLLAGWLAECRPTWLTAAPVVHAAVLDAAGPALAELPLRVVRSTSAPLSDDLARRWAIATPAPLVEAYAVTEAAGQVAATEPGAREPGTVGVARHGFEIEVRDEHGRPCPTGVRGEVVVRGPNTARRYHADPEATARVFVDGWLRTGDIGSLDRAGRLRVVGRTSDTVNRGGEKVWLPDIDAACLSHPLTGQATAFGVPHPRLGEDVEVAVVPVPGREVVPGELRHYLSGRLPPHLVPRRVHVVDGLPVGVAGKPRRRLLAERFAPERVASARPRGTRPPLAVAVAALWCDVLGVEHVDDEDDFLAAGGDSILGTKLLAAVSEVLGVDLPTAVLYGEGSTVVGMARQVAAARDRGTGGAERGVRPRGDDRPAPLSFGQQRLWALHQFAPDSPAYNVPLVFRLSGPLDEDALESAVRGLLVRHEVLRGRVVVRDGVPAQVAGTGTDVWLRRVDAPGDHSGALALVERDVRRPFALDRRSPVRALLVRIAPDEALFALTLHHLVTDGWSNDLIVRELTERYAAARAGRPADLPPLPVQYADFAVWERERATGPLLAAGLDWWRERLADLPPPLVLESAERPAEPGMVGHAVPFALDADTTSSLRGLARAEGTTLAVVLLAGCHAALARHTGTTDVVVGLLSADRPRPELQDVVGFFLTTLPTRLDCADDLPFRTLVRRARDWVVAAYDRRHVPFEQVLKAVAPDRALGVTPLTQVSVGVEKEDAVPGFDGVSAVRLDNLEGGARADLEFHFHEGAATVTGQLVHAVDVVRYETASALTTRLVGLLGRVGRDPGLLLSDSHRPNDPLPTNGVQV